MAVALVAVLASGRAPQKVGRSGERETGVESAADLQEFSDYASLRQGSDSARAFARG